MTTTTTTDPHSVRLATEGAAVDIRYVEPREAVLELHADPSGSGARAGGRLMAAALAEARAHGVDHVRTALDAARPSSGFVLDAFRATTVVQDVSLRRAGATVLVEVRLLPC